MASWLVLLCRSFACSLRNLFHRHDYLVSLPKATSPPTIHPNTFPTRQNLLHIVPGVTTPSLLLVARPSLPHPSSATRYPTATHHPSPIHHSPFTPLSSTMPP